MIKIIVIFTAQVCCSRVEVVICYKGKISSGSTKREISSSLEPLELNLTNHAGGPELDLPISFSRVDGTGRPTQD